MLELLRRLFLSDEYMPHGECYMWRPGLVWLHVVSDALIGTAYVVISVTLARLVRTIRIPFSPMILAFGLFIGVCGLTHYMEVVTLWVPDYWLSGVVKAITAAASVATGAYLFQAGSAIVGTVGQARLAEERRVQLESAHQALADIARRHKRAFDALSALSQALVRAGQEQALLDASCRVFVELCGYRMCWVGLADDDERRSVRPAAHAGHEDGYLAEVEAVWSDTARGRGPSGVAIRTRTPVVVGDIQAEPSFAPWRAQALRRGYASVAALPLVAGGKSLGVLVVYADRLDAFGGDEVRLLGDLVDDLAFGIAALRARADRDRITSQLVLADRMVSIGTMAAGVAHEINNPLAYMLGAIDFAQQEVGRLGARPGGGDLQELGQALAEAREGAVRVKHVVRDLKTFSRADEERQERVDLRAVLESSAHMAFNEIKYRARLVRDLGATPPVLASESRLGQVFLNLLINAAQAIPEGDVERNEIRLVSRSDPQGRAVVEVHDTGAGIPPEALDRIFDPFFTTKPVGVGTGLGLSICRSIVAAHGGEIAVESAVGRGTVMRVTLPPAPDAPAATPAPQAPEVQGRRGRVLVLDDEPSVRTSIQRLLRGEHEVLTCGRAQEALDLIARGERFDAILCDLMMPGLTGMEFHARLLALVREQAERVVFLTGGAFTASARQFLEQVVNLRLEKPFDAATLRAVVRSLVR